MSIDYTEEGHQMSSETGSLDNEMDRDAENEACRFMRERNKAKFHGEASMREEFGVLMGKNVAQSSSLWVAQIAADQVGGKVVRCTVTTSQWVEVES